MKGSDWLGDQDAIHYMTEEAPKSVIEVCTQLPYFLYIQPIKTDRLYCSCDMKSMMIWYGYDVNLGIIMGISGISGSFDIIQSVHTSRRIRPSSFNLPLF